MRKLHGIAREIAIDEQIAQYELLNSATREWGLEDDCTVELYKMKERGENYKAMKKFYELVNQTIATE